MNKSLAPTTFPDGMGSPETADGVFPRTVRHFAGSTFLPQAPTRVVVLATGELDAALCLGTVPVGSTAGAMSAAVPAYLRASFPGQGAALQTLAATGTRTAPDLGAIAALRPDLIVGTHVGVHGCIAGELGAIAPTVLMGGHGYNWKQDFLLFAEALGTREKARATMAAYDDRVQRMKDGLARTAGAGVSASFVRFGPKGMEVFGSWSFVDTIARDLGLHRPDGQTFQAASRTISLDEIAAVQADWIFYSAPDQPDAQATRAAWAGPWDALAAVQQGRAVQVDSEPWHANAGPMAATVVLDDLAAALALA